MGFTKKINQDFFLENNQLVLDPNYLVANVNKFKKMTGSRFSAILNKSQFVSPFKIWCIMTNIFVDEIDETLTRAGTIIEPKIHALVCEKMHINFKQYNPFQIKWDVFQNNAYFGGIPDGEPVDSNGNLLYPDFPILEIKTASIDSFKYKKVKNDFILEKDENGYPIVKNKGEKRQKWFDTNQNIIVPIEYQFQLGLYCYLRNVSKGLFAVCFLETQDYISPEKCNVYDRELKLVNFNVDLEAFNEHINYAKQWYDDYIKTGRSPKMTKEDLLWLKNEGIY